MAGKRPWYEGSGVNAWLILIASVLGLAVLVKDGWITAAKLSANKDLFDTISKIATTTALLFGGVLAYLRFFKGRTLRPKLNIKPQSGLVPCRQGFLHWLEIEIQNTGSVAFWHYELKLYATYHGQVPRREEVTQFMGFGGPQAASEQLVDVGESAFEQAFLLVPPDIDALTFEIIVIGRNRATWTRCLTVRNSDDAAQPMAPRVAYPCFE